MLNFQRIFQTRDQALDVYKSQLRNQELFVESFEGYPKGTDVRVSLEIRETAQKIALNGTVERLIGKTEAQKLGYGQRPGIVLNVPITPDTVEPLRAFFLAQAPRTAAQVPEEKTTVPLENISELSPQDALAQVRTFLRLADNGSLYQIFNVRQNVDRKALRGIYNAAVKKLHPDSHGSSVGDELSELLGMAYQLFNEAYKILQHPVQSEIYMDVSRQNKMFNGMSLNAYKKWMEEYRLRSASNIRMCEELVAKAERELAEGLPDRAMQSIQLALQYDPYNEAARSFMK